MPQVVQARCPGCLRALRFPADWVRATLRCKHCGMVVQARPRAAAPTNGSPAAPTPAPAAAPAPAAVAAPAAPAVTAPAPAAPTPEPAHDTADGFNFGAPAPFGDLDPAAPPLITPRYRRSRGAWKMPVFAGVFVLLVGGAAGALMYKPELLPQFSGKLNGTAAAGRDADTAEGPSGKAKAPDLPATTTDFPRRMLAISVNNYLYANPVAYGYGGEGPAPAGKARGKVPDRSVHALLQRMGDTLHIPESQRIELSDSAPREVARPPLKAVIENTITDFCQTSRPQDRIIILFVGHAVEFGDEAYLVPIEGALATKKTLIPLAWVYDRLKACKARQRVLIADLCRLDPGRGEERPGSGPLGEKIDAALKNPPPGVQVWTACTAKQYSYEGVLDLPDREAVVHGGIFIDELYEAVGPYQTKKVPLPIQKPQDPLPLELLAQGADKAPGVHRATATEVDKLYQEKQTPRLVGAEPADGAPYSPEEPPPARLAVRMPPAPEGGVAQRDLIAGILRQTEDIPPVKKSQEGVKPLTPETLPPFPAKVMAAYKEDAAPSSFREAVTKAIGLLKDPKLDKAFNDRFAGGGDGSNNAIKAIILKQQREPAIIQSELETALEELEAVEKERDGETSARWLATYDYVHARLLERIAYVYEYNYMLGQIRKDALPKRGPNDTGYVLASRDKFNSGSEARKKADQAKKILKKLAKDHKGTPYEILAKREQLNALGLEWRPTR